MKSRAFTLIELLVVVLIIGILAAIALPQYRVAVLKARAVEAMLALNALEKAQIVYKLANGSYATSKEDLDIEISQSINNSSGFDSYAQIYVRGTNMLLEWVWPQTSTPHRCIAQSDLEKQVCRSLGGVPFDHPAATGTIQYYRLP